MAIYKEKKVFTQLISFLGNFEFRRIVHKHDGDEYVKLFSCDNQLLTLTFGQLVNRESLRDLVVALVVHKSKCYHFGLGKNPIAKTTFVITNQYREYRIFEEVAFYKMDATRSNLIKISST